MHSIRFVLIVAVVLSCASCSRFGRGGAGSPDDLDYGMGEGNIPLAEAGSELADVHFAFDSATLSESEKATLQQNGQWLMDNPGQKVVVEGHCDERGTAEYNLALGERRAQSVFDYLRSLGVKSSQVSTVSYGEEVPLDTGHGEAAWAKNRRAHFARKAGS